MDELDPISPEGIRLDPRCLTWRFSRASGPGGQHVNTTASRVELRCHLDEAGLSPALHHRLVEQLGPVVTVVSSAERSQFRNRRRALQRLAERLDAAATPEPPRQATRPSRSQRQGRLDDKHRRSSRKRDRAWRSDDD